METRSNVPAKSSPLQAVQALHRMIARAFDDYQAASEERRQLAAEIASSRELIDVLIAAGWSEDEVRQANVDKPAQRTPPVAPRPEEPTKRRSPRWMVK